MNEILLTHTAILFCNCIAAAWIRCQNENESVWLLGRDLTSVPHHSVKQFDKRCSSSTITDLRRLSWHFMDTFFILTGVVNTGPSYEFYAWLVVDKKEAIILLQHAILVPRSIAYLNIEDTVSKSLWKPQFVSEILHQTQLWTIKSVFH